MPSPNSAGVPIQTVVFMAKSMQRILEDEREGETASQRMKQLAVMMVIYTMQTDGEPVTVTNICKKFHAPRQVVVDVMKMLVERGLITYRTEAHGRAKGRVYVYSLTPRGAGTD
ncbi:MAG: winged helix DNA-binding protein [Sphingobium sp.]